MSSAPLLLTPIIPHFSQPAPTLMDQERAFQEEQIQQRDIRAVKNALSVTLKYLENHIFISLTQVLLFQTSYTAMCNLISRVGAELTAQTGPDQTAATPSTRTVRLRFAQIVSYVRACLGAERTARCHGVRSLFTSREMPSLQLYVLGQHWTHQTWPCAQVGVHRQCVVLSAF